MAKDKNTNEKYSEFYKEGYLYEVYNINGDRVMFTDCPSAIDDKKTINMMLNSGYKIKINGKMMSKTKISEEIEKIVNC